MFTTFQVSPTIESISAPFSGILLDAYGVFWGGHEVGPLPGSMKMMEKLVSQGKIVGILSNSTQLVAKEMGKIEKHGFMQGKHFHFFITSGTMARHIFLNEQLPFKTLNNTFWVFGGDHPMLSPHLAIFKDTPYQETLNIHEADFIYLSIPHLKGEDQVNPDMFRNQVKQLKTTNLPMVCANPDRFAQEGNPPRSVVRQGSIAALYEEMGGKVFYIGKPSQKAFFNAMQEFIKLNITSPSEVLMVGDTPETDIRGARCFGMSSALIVHTGIMADRVQLHGLDTVIQSLPSPDYPDFFIERLGAHHDF